MTLRLLVASIAVAGLTTGCSSDSSGTAATTETEMTKTVSTISGKLASVSNIIGGATASSRFMNDLTDLDYGARATGIDAVWTTDPGVPPLSNSGTSSLKTWISSQFNENFTNSNGANITFAGRISGALQIFCYIGSSGVTFGADDLPVAGVYTETITSAMATACGSDDFSSDVTVEMTITNTTDTTYYDRLISVELPGTEACPFVFYARYNDSAINLAQAEDQNCDGRDHASSAVFHYDAATQVSRFMYISQAFSGFPSGYEVYRGYLDEVADEARILGFYGGDDDGDTSFDSGVVFSAVGKPVAGGTVALSTKVMSTTGAVTAGTYNGCINSETLTVDTDNSLSCTLTGVDVDTPYTNFIQGEYSTNSSRADIYNVGETTAVGFTNTTDMYN